MGYGRDRDGFTLMEVLIVVALLSILAVLLFIGWQSQIGKARDAKRKADLREWREALFHYEDDYGCFPDEVEMICGSDALDPYMDAVPCDPSDADEYQYKYVKESCKVFYIYARLDNDSDEDIAKVGCAGGCGPSGDTSYDYLISSGNVIRGNQSPTPGSGSPTPTSDPGIRPSCGGNNPYCFPGVCGTCCPGSSYRCNAAGNGCIVDTACSL